VTDFIHDDFLLHTEAIRGYVYDVERTGQLIPVGKPGDLAAAS